MSKFLFKSIRLILIKNNNNVNQYVQSFCNSYIAGKYEKEKKRKTQRISKITLIHTDKSISVISLESAEKLANRRNLELTHVPNKFKSSRDVYELVKPSQIDNITSDVEKTNINEQKIKSVKLFTIKRDIMAYDLNIKIDNINRALKRNYMVKIFISDPKGIKEDVVEDIKKRILGDISAIKKKNGTITLVYIPLLKDENISSKEDVNDL